MTDLLHHHWKSLQRHGDYAGQLDLFINWITSLLLKLGDQPLVQGKIPRRTERFLRAWLWVQGIRAIVGSGVMDSIYLWLGKHGILHRETPQATIFASAAAQVLSIGLDGRVLPGPRFPVPAPFESFWVPRSDLTTEKIPYRLATHEALQYQQLGELWRPSREILGCWELTRQGKSCRFFLEPETLAGVEPHEERQSNIFCSHCQSTTGEFSTASEVSMRIRRESGD